MRRLRTRLRLVRASGDRGVALAMVVGIASVLLLLISLTMTFSVSGLIRSNHDADWDAAMSAAFAGVADYQGRLTNDPSYQQYGNPASKFTIANGSQASVTMPPTSRANPAFDVRPTSLGGVWAPVPLTDGLPANASFRYEVDNSKYASNGILHLRATGRVDTVTRSVVANIKQTGFTNYVYFTDYEELDPTLNNVNCTVAYAWAATRSSSCLINFIAGDTFDGQVHSNDTLNICGGTFKQKVTTANPNPISGKLYTQSNCSGGAQTPTFSAGAPVNAAQITMPPPQAQLDQVRTDIPSKVPSPGCLYTGPTKITFSVSGSTAYMTVRSPWTKKTQLSNAAATAGTTPAFCGTPGDPTKTVSQNDGTLSGVAGQTIAIGPTSQLYNNLAYVQAVPSDTANANYWPATSSPNGNSFGCVGADLKAAGNGLGYPVANEIVPSIASYGCRAGDVFVEGTMHSALTINAEHFAWITGKLVYQDSANDILGLVGAGAVWVWNPIVCTNPTPFPTTSGSSCSSRKAYLTFEATSSSTNCARTINAAILSNNHSFEVHNYDAGIFIGYLCVTGSIAQEFRGPVGQGSGSSGFLKRYSYDTRLLNSPPPKFPTPRTTSYDVNTEIEVKTAFGSDGAPLP
ncbi:hypothetical protein SAMN04515691_0876 [Leifsonia sp. 98AMF]|nr:hypothetical protein SAMN04515690_3144 [Leifsonia sp. 197AMF]SDI81306.1 hypothetical protein SAMN04515684_0644 [Leifsonia sp. 466MF]SDK03678.1 hypothetical protein SAMN04515683_2105 [Leifsonia sp. 157MF]SDN84441.1 hypothetical protein SAMN04515686_2846 [Leifsonia sp. 509MF]SEN22287.1 hypothetical protein SAMN04515685_2090 [Leifsonia sp. 467MF]SFL88246.1 hypothetical protein SAMN04515691_0876 [Leifsonia sp. 98AMF]